MMTPWDRRAFVSSAALTVVLLAVTLLITAVTDEGGVALAERLSRTVPLAPVAAALATALTVLGPRTRSESRALEALGRSPISSSLGAATGAFAVCVTVALAVLLDPRLSTGAFFPTIAASAAYRFDDGVFTNLAAGWSVMRDGTVALPGAFIRGAVPTPIALGAAARVTAASLTLLASVGFIAVVVATPRGRWGWSLFAILETAAASTFCLQAAAAGRVPLAAVPIPSTLLLLGAAWVIVASQSEQSGGRRRRPT